MKKITTLIIMALIALMSMGVSNCHGKFMLVKKLHRGVDSIENRWVRSALVWILYFIPIVLYIAYAIDIIIFNLIEFWTGNNLLSGADFDENGTAVKEIVKDNISIKMTYTNFGQTMLIQSYINGVQDGQTLVLKKSEPGIVYKLEIAGELSRVDHSLNKLDYNRMAKAQATMDNAKLVY